MAEIFGAGLTHYPPLLGRDVDMAWVLRWVLEDPDLPSDLRVPGGWPEEMRSELGQDDGLTAAREHRQQLVKNIRKIRAAMDDFQPDVIFMWGDDQYENFREDAVPGFAVLAYDDVTVRPWMKSRFDNVWAEPKESGYVIRGAPDAARSLAGALITDGFDVAYSYKTLHHESLPHAFANTALLLDYDRRGFNTPIVAISVNCYGRRVVSFKGGRSRLGDAVLPMDPPSPSPARCMALGAAVARAALESPLRIALIASSSWSHAFMTSHLSFLHPDHVADRRLFKALQDGDYATWRGTTLAEIEHAGQQEALNWFCLMGAMEELGQVPIWSDLTETYLFNSNKAFAIYASEETRSNANE